ncbi:hypothetical protein J2D78_01415 [Microbacterium maritypicum]|uniref:hypothetical protein n=1 Tax=Microbacterium maritypicum TaxID=33918 RepID=UPI001B31FCDF|nr:hypothetical protein [Microbacterium liquefaciens]MBP5800733.1 hypothetical protein [Microbacterium liquefaciens]
MSAPTLTVYSDAAPCPRVEVFFPSFVAGTESVTVYRLASGQEREVRGAVGAPTGGTLTRIDFEVPFNTPATYRAEQFNGAGASLGFTPSASVTVVSDDTWMHNPLNPEGAARVVFGRDSAAKIVRPTPGVISRPLGRRVGVVMSEPRQGVVGLQIDVRTTSDADADAVQAMFGDQGMPPVVCIRLGRTYGVMRVPQPLFLSAMNVAEIDISLQWGMGEISHQLDGDEVDPPIPGLFVPLLTRADLNAFFATRAALNAGGLTRADLNRRYDLAGTA